MKRCLKCSSNKVSSEWKCEDCGWCPTISSNIPIFAEQIDGQNESYDPEWYSRLVALEEDNFWFVSRNNLIIWLAKKYTKQACSYLEIGCGSGFVLRSIQRTFPEWKIWATEAQLEGLKFARSRVSSQVLFAQMDALEIPFRNEFDVIGAFDVIEHIKDDTAVLAELYLALKPQGLFLVSVPQHMFLWSQFDEIGCHFRRYSRQDLHQKLIAAGFEIVDSTSFNSLLLPAMLLSRITKKAKNPNLNIMDELIISKVTNAILKFVMQIEFILFKLGVRWPMGGSRIIVARKK